MTIKKNIGPLLLLIFSAIGFLFMNQYNTSSQTSVFAPWVPVGLVALYALIVRLFFMDQDNQDRTDNYVDSVYFIGFLFTLLAIFNIFLQYDIGNADFLEEGQLVNGIIHNLGYALSTTVAGILFRNMLRSIQLEYGESPVEKSLHGVLNYSKEFMDYIRNLEELKKTIMEINVESKELTQQLGKQMKTQQSAMQTSTDQLVRFQESVSKVNTDLRALGKLSTNINGFDKDIDALQNALGNFCEVLEKKIVQYH